MKFIDLVSMGIRNLLRRKSRTLLTVLGVVIGAASIVIMLSIGLAMDLNFKNQLEGMGNLTVINVERNWGGDPSLKGKGEVYLNEKAVKIFAAMPEVEAVMPMKEIYLRIATRKYTADVSVIGVMPEVMETFGIKVGEGRLLSAEDNFGIVLGAYVKDDFVNPKLRNPWKSRGQANVDVFNDRLIITKDYNYGRRPAPGMEKSRLKAYNLSVVGVMSQQMSNNNWNSYMSIQDVERIEKDAKKIEKNSDSGRNKDGNVYSRIQVKVKKMDDVEKVQAKMKDLGYMASSLLDYQKEMKKTSGMIQMVLGGIGAISLLIAALGITNTMIMAIYERTREIGVMKVLGANISDIKKLFLFEAGMIGFWGGLIGLILSTIASIVLNHLVGKGGGGFLGGFMGYVPEGTKQYLSYIPPWLYVLALSFSVVIGIVSGYLPARRATKLSALTAIKNEG